MFILLFVTSFVGMIVFSIICIKRSKKINKISFFFFPTLIFAMIFVDCLALMFTLQDITDSTIDNNISMYEKETTEIEENISTTIKSYIDFESETFENFNDEDVANLTSLYLELNSDTSIQQQLQVYWDNNTKINELK